MAVLIDIVLFPVRLVGAILHAIGNVLRGV
jgi:hypothetical protein